MEAPVNFSQIEDICELATLRCYYHNVIKFEEEGKGFTKFFGNHGYKKMWIEYSGIVDLGIQVGKVNIGQPDKNGMIK